MSEDNFDSSNEISKDVKKEAKKGAKDSKKKNIVKEKFQEYYAEFRKIVWPSKPDLLKQTVTVIIISLLFGAYIALLDGALRVVFNLFYDLVS
ncbi:MAG: preprotein translocase subunit SecE [Defluviitaleaceae bacterium]|nr:preprotein translocase subunit SecE [Defluviitaleaceae bacterium]